MIAYNLYRDEAELQLNILDFSRAKNMMYLFREELSQQYEHQKATQPNNNSQTLDESEQIIMIVNNYDGVGFLTFHIDLEGEILHILKIYIYRRFRRLGYCSNVIKHTKDIAIRLGIKYITISTKYASTAHNIYKQIGFKPYQVSMIMDITNE